MIFEIMNLEASESLQELKRALSSIKINYCNKDVKEMLTTMQMIYTEILQEGGRNEEHEEDMLHDLGAIQNQEFKL